MPYRSQYDRRVYYNGAWWVVIRCRWITATRAWQGTLKQGRSALTVYQRGYADA